jgi:hypothetical protein
MQTAVFLGSEPFTMINVDRVQIPGVIATGDNGKLMVIGNCQIESRQAGRVTGLAVRVDRVGGDEVVLDLTVLKHDPVTIRAFDAIGSLLSVPLDASLQPGRYIVRINTANWSSGAALVDVSHAGMRRTVSVMIVR